MSGTTYFRRAYRMSYASFWKLHNKVALKIIEASEVPILHLEKFSLSVCIIFYLQINLMYLYQPVFVWHLPCVILRVDPLMT